MAELSVNKTPFHVHRWLPGLLLTAAIAAGAAWLASQPWLAGAGFGALTLAIIIGIVLGNSLYPRVATPCDSGCCWPNSDCCASASFFTASASPCSRSPMSASAAC
jgi:Predicted membrane protein